MVINFSSVFKHLHCQYLQIKKQLTCPTYYKNSVFLICVIFSIRFKLQYSYDFYSQHFIVSVLVKTDFFLHWTSNSRSPFNGTLQWNLKFYMFLFDTFLCYENPKLWFKGKKLFLFNIQKESIVIMTLLFFNYLIQDSYKMASLLWHGSDHRVLMRRCTFGVTP